MSTPTSARTEAHPPAEPPGNKFWEGDAEPPKAEKIEPTPQKRVLVEVLVMRPRMLRSLPSARPSSSKGLT